MEEEEADVADDVLMLGFSIGFSSLAVLSDLLGSDDIFAPVGSLFFEMSLRSILLPNDGKS